MIWPQRRPTLHSDGCPRLAGRHRSVGPYSETVRGYMSKVEQLATIGPEAERQPAPRRQPRPRIALLSNPKSTGNLAQLPRIREFCADHPDIFHYEVEHASQIGEAMQVDRADPAERAGHQRRRRHRPGGADRALQRRSFRRRARRRSPCCPAARPTSSRSISARAAIPSRRSSACSSSPGPATSTTYIVARELIALRRRGENERPVIGMFLGGAGLADTMLYCRDKIYPLGLPNGLAHVLTAFALLA